MEETKTTPQSQSPKKEDCVSESNTQTMDILGCISNIIGGKKLTRLEWGDKDIYGYLSKTTCTLTLRKKDGVDYSWLVNEGDLLGKDWVIVK